MDKAETIQKLTQELLDKMVDSVAIEVEEDEGMYHVNIKTEEEAPTVIGRHGETIRAIQKILEVMLYKATQDRVSVLINVNDYREKQIERLQYIADQAVEKVNERNSATYLRGFSSYERRVMHEHVGKQHPELTSYSVGEGRDRRLVIDLKKKDGEHQDEEYDHKQESEQE